MRTIFLLLFLAGCVSIVVDNSMNAAEAGDLTLQVTACKVVSPDGFSACRLREGEKIETGFFITLPPPGGPILGGEVTILYKDLAPITIGIKDAVTFVPFEDVLGPGAWSRKDHDGTIVLLATLRYKTSDGIEHTTKGLGEVRVMVLAAKYDGILPVTSGFVAWKKSIQCDLVYSTSFRSGRECR